LRVSVIEARLVAVSVIEVRRELRTIPTNVAFFFINSNSFRSIISIIATAGSLLSISKRSTDWEAEVDDTRGTAQRRSKNHGPAWQRRRHDDDDDDDCDADRVAGDVYVGNVVFDGERDDGFQLRR